jgi:hypothetical protein
MKKIADSKPITNFFKPVSTIDYQINLLLERKRQMLEAENRQKRDEELKEKAQIERKRQMQLDYERRKNRVNLPSAEEIIRDEIDFRTSIDGDNTMFTPHKRAKPSTKQVGDWKVIARYALEHGEKEAIEAYENEFDPNLTYNAKYSRIVR